MATKKSESSVATVKSKVKAVFLGEQSTGKTSILIRFMSDKFQESQGATVGIDFMGKNLNVGHHHLRLQLWDTAGQERFRSLIPSYLKDAMVTFIVFDLTNLKSLENIGEWVDLCQNNRNEKNILVFLGNKSDLKGDRQIDDELITEKLNKYRGKYFEVSAKTGQNIHEVFNYAAQEFVRVSGQEQDMGFSQKHSEFDKKIQQMKSKPHEPSEGNIKIEKPMMSTTKDAITAKGKKKKTCC